MDLGDAVSLLRRRIQEVTADNWTDADLITLINLACRDAEIEVLIRDKKAFITVSTANLVVDASRYPLPAGFVRAHRVEIKDDSAAAGYKPISKIRDYDTYSESGDSVVDEANPRYAILGDWLKIIPTPNSAVTAGIRLTWVHTVSISDENDILPILLLMHDAIVHRAKILALHETEETAQDSAAEWTRAIDRLQQYYMAREDSAPALQPDGV
jgi:hypothetical protein